MVQGKTRIVLFFVTEFPTIIAILCKSSQILTNPIEILTNSYKSSEILRMLHKSSQIITNPHKPCKIPEKSLQILYKSSEILYKTSQIMYKSWKSWKSWQIFTNHHKSYNKHHTYSQILYKTSEILTQLLINHHTSSHILSPATGPAQPAQPIPAESIPAQPSPVYSGYVMIVWWCVESSVWRCFCTCRNRRSVACWVALAVFHLTVDQCCST